MRLHQLATVTLFLTGFALAAPAAAQPTYGGGSGGPSYGGGDGPTYGKMPRIEPYPGIRNGDGDWIPYPPSMARKISSKKGPNGWTYSLMQDVTGQLFIQIEDSSGKDVHILGRVAMPGGKKTYPVR